MTTEELLAALWRQAPAGLAEIFSFSVTCSRLSSANHQGSGRTWLDYTDAQLAQQELLKRNGIGGVDPVGLAEIRREQARRAGGTWREYQAWRLA